MITVARIFNASLLLLFVGSISAQAQESFSIGQTTRSSFRSCEFGCINFKNYIYKLSGRQCVATYDYIREDNPSQPFKGTTTFSAVAYEGGHICRDGEYRNTNTVTGATNSGAANWFVYIKNGQSFSARASTGGATGGGAPTSWVQCMYNGGKLRTNDQGTVASWCQSSAGLSPGRDGAVGDCVFAEGRSGGEFRAAVSKCRK